jgi:hypothetical protein
MAVRERYRNLLLVAGVVRRLVLLVPDRLRVQQRLVVLLRQTGYPFAACRSGRRG